jgi:phosphatidylglycerophosphate synthase
VAHVLTATRLLLVPVVGPLMARGGRGAAAASGVVIAVAVATDLLDGPAARRAGVDGPGGLLFDHATDCLFVTSALVGAARRGAVPRVLPVLVVASFAQYVADSPWANDRAGLGVVGDRVGMRRNRLGRVNGVLYFVPPGLDVLARRGLGRPSWARAVSWGLAGSTMVSMVSRARWLMPEGHHGHASSGRRLPGAGRPPR